MQHVYKSLVFDPLHTGPGTICGIETFCYSLNVEFLVLMEILHNDMKHRFIIDCKLRKNKRYTIPLLKSIKIIFSTMAHSFDKKLAL